MNRTENRIAQCLSEGNYAYAERICERAKEQTKGTVILRCLFGVAHQEEQHEGKCLFSTYSSNYELLIKHFIRLKLLLRRLEYSMPDEEEFFVYCEQNNVSVYFVKELIQKNIFNPQKVCRKLIEKYGSAEWKDEKKQEFYGELLEQLEETADE